MKLCQLIPDAFAAATNFLIACDDTPCDSGLALWNLPPVFHPSKPSIPAQPPSLPKARIPPSPKNPTPAPTIPAVFINCLLLLFIEDKLTILSPIPNIHHRLRP